MNNDDEDYIYTYMCDLHVHVYYIYRSIGHLPSFSDFFGYRYFGTIHFSSSPGPRNIYFSRFPSSSVDAHVKIHNACD